MAIHSSILTWNIPWTEDPSGLQSMRFQGLDTTEHTNNPQLLETMAADPWIWRPDCKVMCIFNYTEGWHP